MQPIAKHVALSVVCVLVMTVNPRKTAANRLKCRLVVDLRGPSSPCINWDPESHWCYLANMIQRFVLGSDLVLCQITRISRHTDAAYCYTCLTYRGLSVSVCCSRGDLYKTSVWFPSTSRLTLYNEIPWLHFPRGTYISITAIYWLRLPMWLLSFSR